MNSTFGSDDTKMGWVQSVSPPEARPPDADKEGRAESSELPSAGARKDSVAAELLAAAKGWEEAISRCCGGTGVVSPAGSPFSRADDPSGIALAAPLAIVPS